MTDAWQKEAVQSLGKAASLFCDSLTGALTGSLGPAWGPIIQCPRH